MAEIAQKLRPWTVPSFATVEVSPGLRQDRWREAPEIPLADLPAEVLSEMCDEFRASVFAAAGKADPYKWSDR